MGVKAVTEKFERTLDLREERTRRTLATLGRWVRYAIVGGSGTLLYMLLVVVFVELMRIPPVSSAVIGFILVCIFTYTLNRLWVFASSRRHTYAFPRFVMVSIVGLLLNALIMYVTVDVLELWYGFWLIGATAIVPPTNYLLHAYWSFRQIEPKEEAADANMG